MSDRKYRQRGYMEGDRERDRESPPKPRPESRPRDDGGPRTPRMMAFGEKVRCTACGTALQTPITLVSRCPKCGVELHACRQCVSFDPGSRFQCMQPIPVRIDNKQARNACELFEPRIVVERDTSSSGPIDARQAFENLFKK